LLKTNSVSLAQAFLFRLTKNSLRGSLESKSKDTQKRGKRFFNGPLNYVTFTFGLSVKYLAKQQIYCDANANDDGDGGNDVDVDDDVSVVLSGWWIQLSVVKCATGKPIISVNQTRAPMKQQHTNSI